MYCGNIFNKISCFTVCFVPFYEKGCLGCVNIMAETALNSKLSGYSASEPGGLSCLRMARSTLLYSLGCSFWGYTMTQRLGLSFSDDCMLAGRCGWYDLINSLYCCCTGGTPSGEECKSHLNSFGAWEHAPPFIPPLAGGFREYPAWAGERFCHSHLATQWAKQENFNLVRSS